MNNDIDFNIGQTNETWTWGKDSDTYISLTILIKGFLKDNVKNKTKKTDMGNDFSKVKSIPDFENSTATYTETYTYSIPEAKQWEESDGDALAKYQAAVEYANTDSNYINKRESIITQIEAHNG